MNIFATITLSYLFGCFSSAYFVGKLFKNIDIRGYGSGNAGTTNAMRVMGKKLGVLTFLLDFLKGILAVYIGFLLLGYNGGLIAAIFVVLGHDFPVFLGFKGGKGVATTIACMAILNFYGALFSVIVGILTAILSKYVSLGSIVFFTILPIINSLTKRPFNRELLITSLLLSLIGIYRHKDNIKRLLNGNENKIGG